MVTHHDHCRLPCVHPPASAIAVLLRLPRQSRHSRVPTVAPGNSQAKWLVLDPDGPPRTYDNDPYFWVEGQWYLRDDPNAPRRKKVPVKWIPAYRPRNARPTPIPVWHPDRCVSGWKRKRESE